MSVVIGGIRLARADARTATPDEVVFHLPDGVVDGASATAELHALGDPVGSADGSIAFTISLDQCQTIDLPVQCVDPGFVDAGVVDATPP